MSAKFFEAVNGTMPVRDWLLSLSDDDRKIIGDDIRTVNLVGLLACPCVVLSFGKKAFGKSEAI